MTAYPRECGGNAHRWCTRPSWRGLSPRVRGKPCPAIAAPSNSGPIPASAGETDCGASGGLAGWAYPRECGGNLSMLALATAPLGLSPRVRGKPLDDPDEADGGGPIPASAGETEQILRTHLLPRAYPRECGGNAADSRGDIPVWGLSPRVRGKQQAAALVHPRRGPIPASAGETPWTAVSNALARAYPRECGGNREIHFWVGGLAGLSPRVRGKRKVAGKMSINLGPIPASAGETRAGSAPGCAFWAYPRECGGNQMKRLAIGLMGGLSPRVRGKRIISA